MTVVDLTTTPVPAPTGLLDGLPRRVGLTLPELLHAAALAGGASLPFDVATPPTPTGDPGGDRLGARLGGRPAGRRESATPEPAYDAVLAGLPDPAESLTRRGLLAGEAVEPGLAGALGLLASPRLAVDLDVSVDGAALRSWHRQRGEAVALLSSADGLLFELAWCHTGQWPDELARVATVPDLADSGERSMPRPGGALLPFELADAAVEAVAAGRIDLLPTLLAQTGPVTDPEGRPENHEAAMAVLAALTERPRGRLRALATDVTRPDALPVATVSWLLREDRWLGLAAGDRSGWLRVAPTQPADLGRALAPALAAVTS